MNAQQLARRKFCYFKALPCKKFCFCFRRKAQECYNIIYCESEIVVSFATELKLCHSMITDGTMFLVTFDFKSKKSVLL